MSRSTNGEKNMPQEDDLRKCPKCGCEEFHASQAVRGGVPVIARVDQQGNTSFVRNPTDDGLMDTSGLDCDAPAGPFVCVKCGQKL
jgi:hypothetical protein